MAFGVGGQAEINYELLQGQHRTFDHYRLQVSLQKHGSTLSVGVSDHPLNTCKNIEFIDSFPKHNKI